MRFLVTGANGDIGDAIGRILRETCPEATLFGADCAGEWPAKDTYTKTFQLPPAIHPDYLQSLRKLTVENEIDHIIPTSEPEIIKITNNWDKIRDLPLVINDPKIISPFSDKYKTAIWLKENGINSPITVLFEETKPNHLPVIAKPRHGAGSKGIFFIENEEDLIFYKKKKLQNYVAQSYLHDQEIERTCAILRFDEQSRILIMKRKLIGGMSGQIEVERNKKIEELLYDICRKLPCNAFINVQLRVIDGEPFIFEINPRFSSTVMMRHKIGFCDLLWLINARNGKKIPDFKPLEGSKVFRMSREVVVKESKNETHTL